MGVGPCQVLVRRVCIHALEEVTSKVSLSWTYFVASAFADDKAGIRKEEIKHCTLKIMGSTRLNPNMRKVCFYGQKLLKGFLIITVREIAQMATPGRMMYQTKGAIKRF